VAKFINKAVDYRRLAWSQSSVPNGVYVIIIDLSPDASIALKLSVESEEACG
jgi:hypothetical protein